MPRNARNLNARSQLRRAVCILPLAAISFGTLAAQEMTPEAYHAEQLNLHQQIAAIRNDLNAGAQRPSRKDLQKFNSQLRRGIRTTDPGFAKFQEILRYSVFQLSDPTLNSDGNRVQQLKANIERKISGAGSQIRLQSQQEAMRTDVMSEALRLYDELLQNNFVARSAAIELMPLLVVHAPPNKPVAVRKMLPGVARSLAGVLADPNQPDTVKARASMSIILHLRRVIAGGVDQSRYVQAIHDELVSPIRSPVYQLLLVDALSMITIPRQVEGERRALAIETLVMVMQDKRRDLRTRCRAAAALGQVGFDRSVDFAPIAWKIVQLAAETGNAYNQAGRERSSWRVHGQWLYQTFHHIQADEATAENPQGILNRTPGAELVNDAYRKTLPVALHMCFGKPSVPKGDLKAASEWVLANQPPDLTYEPQAEPIVP